MAIFFHGKGKEKLFLVLFVFFVVPFFSGPYATTSIEAEDKCGHNQRTYYK